MSGQDERTVAGYRLLRKTGSDGAGGFGLGSLWEAVDPSGSLVSLKLASLQALAEVRVKERNQHPSLVQLIGFWVVNEQGEVVNSASEALVDPAGSEGCWLAIATDLHIGTPICARLKECQSEGQPGVPRQELIRYLEDIASAVDFLTTPKYVHGLGVVTLRCDVRPSDILLTPTGARLDDVDSLPYATFRDRESPWRLLGNPRYSAPERLGGAPWNSSPAYSLAVTYFQLRTGSLPFEGQAASSAEMLKVRRENRLNLLALPRGERDVIEKALSVNPKERYQRCVEVLRFLRGVGSDSHPQEAASKRKRKGWSFWKR